jgi:hypothetical protein
MQTAPLAAARLARRYDVDRLRQELDALGAARFTSQRTFDRGKVTAGTTRDWRVLPLRSPGGDPSRTDPGGPGRDGYDYTPYAAEAPYMRSVLAGLPASLRTARLMSLAPGASVDEHCDTPYGPRAGWVRLHLPINTNPGAILALDGEEHCWQPGTLWFGDFSRLHSVRNTGTETRVHLVIDSFLTPALLGLFAEEFVEGLRWSDTLLEREAVPLTPTEMTAMACGVMVPAAFLQSQAYELPPEAGAPDVPGEIYVDDGQLVLESSDGPATLVHIGEGEFRLLGWMTERTVKVDLLDPPLVRFRLRCGSGFAEHVRQGSPATLRARAS